MPKTNLVHTPIPASVLVEVKAALSDVQAKLGVVTSFRPVQQLVDTLQQAVDDTVMQAGSEAYTSMLMFYGHNREAAKGHAPNAQTVYDDLSSRFPGGAKRKIAKA